ncbi:HTH-type transcriptional regulator LuxR (plasmid) [Variovorax sp. SRS16]|uniref:TetR/AcrR family transcriptional regulator n=1 Tax=Variovorax sp. SRS16 TaxID=282217 RepID=UPI001315CE39|nr:TetR/AcrR family transcriptional regulator [Variovorax sp. SRS16]VTU45549.1 HTH-type transcriptional regulator LuxR [Variovorax sp. SRS16]
MTRERSEDYDSKKQLIIDRAAELFAKKGFELTTMVEVANACNASKSHLYHYFPAKEDLLFAVVSEHTRSLTDILSDVVSLPVPAEDRFARFVKTFVEKASESRNEHLVLVNDLKYLPDAKRKQMRKMEGDLVDMMIGLLKEINPAMMKAPKVQGPYALLLFGMIIWTFTWYRKTGEISPRELANRISQLFLFGFKDHAFEA